MVPPNLIDRVKEDVKRYVAAKGYGDGPGVNPLVPRDCVAAFAMARLLTEQGFDHYVSVDPEGLVYGYFCEKLGVRLRSVFVDYPPRRFETRDDLAVIRGRRVLVLEDDVVSGVTLELVQSG